MRRIILVLAAALGLIAPAAAQVNPQNLPANTVYGRLGIGPGPGQAIPFGTLASNMFGNCSVNGAFPIYSTAFPPGFVCSTAGGTGSLATLNGGPLTINPTVNTINQGLVVNQTSPASGSTASGPIAYNLTSITNTYNSTAAGTTNQLPNSYVVGSRINFTIGGSSMGSSQQTAFLSNLNETIASSNAGDTVAIMGYAYSNVANATAGILSALVASTVCDVACTRTRIEGAEINSGYFGAGSGAYRTSLTLSNTGVSQGSTLDTAILVTNFGTAPGAFNKFIAFSSNYSGGPTTILSTSADLFWWEQTTTIANVFNAGNVTVSGSILKFPNAILTGAGTASFGSGTAPATPAIVQATCSSCGQVFLNATTNAAAATSFDGPEGVAASGNNVAALYAIEPLNTSTFFGQAAGNWAGLFASGSANNGLLIGTVTSSVPVIFGTNNTERMRLLAGLAIGTTTDPGAGVVNVLTGFRIGNAAASGHYLRGNGTSYVDSAIQAADLPAPYGATTYTSNGVLYGNGSSNISVTAQGAANTVLTANAGAPVFSAAPVIGTSVTTPIDYGGSAAGSTKTIASTSGAGTTDSIIFETGSQVVAGFINTSQQWSIGPNVAPVSGPTLIVNQNTLQVPTAGLSGTIVAQLGAAANSTSRFELINAGTSGIGFIQNFVQSRGTFSSPTATQSGDILGAFGAAGYGTSYQTAGGAGITFTAAQTFTGANGGTNLNLLATPNGTVAQVTYIQLGGAAGIVFENLGAGAGNGALCGATGILTTGGAVTYDAGANCIASVREAKTDIEPLGDALDEVMHLTPVQFHYRPGYGDGGARLQGGLIAQEMAAIDPRFAAYDDAGKLEGVRYAQSIALAIRAIQQLKADNDNLHTELERRAQ